MYGIISVCCSKIIAAGLRAWSVLVHETWMRGASFVVWRGASEGPPRGIAIS